MIDKTLARMIDETLREMPKMFGIWWRKMLEIPVNQAHLMGLPICVPKPLQLSGILFVNSSPSSASPLSKAPATSDLFDQSALSTLAQRLVEAAKRAGADAADAVAVRGVSQGVEVRDGRVEESERSEGDDVGLRVLVGQRQAVVSTNDISGDGIAKLAERAVAMARVAPDDKYVGLADPSLLAREFADLDLLDREVPSTVRTRAPRLRGRSRGPCGQGRHQIRRRVGLDRHRRHGAGDLDRLPRLLPALQPRHLDDRDLGRRHRHGARLRFHLGPACLRSRFARKRRPQGGRAHRGAVQSAQGRNLQGAGGVRSPGVGIAGRPSRRRHQRRLDRAQDELFERPDGRAAVREEHPHHRRSLAGARPAVADLRRRGRQE